MTFDLQSLPKIVSLQLRIRQYPILGSAIRERMQEELFNRGVITPERLEEEVHERAVASQKLEGLEDPFTEEPPDIWHERLHHVRDYLTEFYFAHNVPAQVFDKIVAGLLEDRTGTETPVTRLKYNPEMAPLALVMRHGKRIEALPPEKREEMGHHLQEIIVVIIKTIVSDRLEYVGTARKWFTIEDLWDIRRRRFGKGKIGGKAAGIELAWKILQSDKQLSEEVRVPKSYFIATDVFDRFKRANDLVNVMNQKYKPAAEVREQYAGIRHDFAAGQLPDEILENLRNLLQKSGRTPLIVRSSSLLEDSYGTSFAGKYDSYFCANQGSPEDKLEALTLAITQIYASVYSPDALLYRQRMGLLDYSERMAILIQLVEGEQHGLWFFPSIAGVAFSRNPFRWTPRIKPEEGLVRVVCGLGTRAVERTDDYARMIALSHPMLRPESGADAIRHYSQKKMDLLNLETNRLETQPIAEVLHGRLPWVRLLATQHSDGYLRKLLMLNPNIDPASLVLTFDQLLQQTEFVPQVKRMLKQLSKHYDTAIDVEFTARVVHEGKAPKVSLCLVQCRPQSFRADRAAEAIPQEIEEADKVLRTGSMVPDGRVDGITFVVVVPLDEYEALADPVKKISIGRVIGRLNQVLQGEPFVLIGPHRWGSNNPDLGVKVTYADVYNTRMLIELVPGSGAESGEPSYGTHFFQDLVEANIFPLAINVDDERGFFHAAHFADAPNLLAQLSPEDADFADVVQVYNLPATCGGKTLSVVMDASSEEALGFLTDARKPKSPESPDA